MNNLTPKQTYSRFGISYVIGYVVYVSLVYIISLIISAISPELIQNGTVSLLISFSVLYIVGYPLMYRLVKDIPRTEIPKKKLKFGSFLACACIAYTLMYLSNILALFLNAKIGSITGKGGTNPIFNVIDNMNPVMQVIVVVICAPIFEELIFRKLLLDRISKYGEVTAMLISGMMFGLFHGNLVQTTYATVLGCFLAFIYLRTGRVIYTILLHFVVNGTSTFVSLFFAKGLDLGEMMEYLNNGDMSGYMDFVNRNAEAFAVLGLVGFVAIILIITGIILMIVLRKKFVFEHREEELEPGKRFSTAILNKGMIIYIIFWLINIIMVQMGFGIRSLLEKLLG